MPKIIEDKQIFKAVIQSIVEHGYEGATTKQIAQYAGVSEVTLFRKYGTKLQLVKQAIAYIMQQSNYAQTDFYTGNVREDLIKMVTTFQNSAIKHKEFIAVIFVEMFRHPELTEPVQQRDHLSEIYMKVIQRYQDEGVLKKEDPVQAVSVLLGPLIYMTMFPKVIPTTKPPRFNVVTHIDRFLNGRLKIPPPKRK